MINGYIGLSVSRGFYWPDSTRQQTLTITLTLTLTLILTQILLTLTDQRSLTL